jgi:hypothetical protein
LVITDVSEELFVSMLRTVEEGTNHDGVIFQKTKLEQLIAEGI